MIGTTVADPTVLAEITSGKSALTNNLNVGVDAAPEAGPENIVLAVWVFKVPVKVPLVVTGEPLTIKMLGKDKPTLETVPAPAPQGAPASATLNLVVPNLVQLPGVITPSGVTLPPPPCA